MSSTQLKLEVIMAAVDKLTGPMRAVMESSKTTSTEVKALRDRIKELNQQSGKVEGFRTLKSQTAVVGHNMAQAQEKVKKLAQEIAATENPTKKMQKAFEAAKREAKDLSTQHTEMTQRVQRQRDALNAAGLATTELASHQRRLKTEVQSTTAALDAEQKKLDGINQRAKQMHAARASYEKSKSLAGRAATGGARAAATGAAIGAVTSIPVMAFANHEEAAINLKVAMMNADGQVGETYKKVTALATQLGNKLPGTTADFMNMMTMLQRQGVPIEKVLGGVGEATAYLAVQLKKTPEAAAEFAAKMQDATRATDKDMLSLMDTIQRAYYLGVDDNNMLQGFSKLSPALSILRKEGVAAAKELAPLLVMSDQAGMAGEAAGNAYRKIFQLSMGDKKIHKANAALKGTGVDLNFTDGKGEFAGLEHMFSQLEKLKTVNTQQRLHALKEAFGDDAETLQALTLMIEKGQSGYNEVAERMRRQADIQQRVNAQLETLKNLWDAASGTFTNAMAAFGESIAPELKATTVWLGSLSERLQQWATDNPRLAAGLMSVVKWVGLTLVVLGGLAIAFSAVIVPMAVVKMAMATMGLQGFTMAAMMGKLWSALKMVGTAMLWLGRLMLANPILAVVAAIAAAAIYVWANWETIGPKFAALWANIRAGAVGLWDYVTGLPAKFVTIGGQVIDGLMAGLSARFEGAKQWFTNMGNRIAQTARDSLGIKSPSRVFAEIGGHVMDGLSMGFDNNEDGPLGRVNSLAKKMAAMGAGITIGASAMAVPIDHRAPLSVSGASSAGGGDTIIQITVNPSAGMDETALAKLVAQEVDRITRQAAVAKRSRFTDAD